VEARGAELVQAVRAGLGRDRTVWGLKLRDGAIAWELYFYDFERARPEVSLAHVRRLLAPFVELDAVETRALPWHMFSVELDAADLAGRRAVPAHLYVDMRSYELRGARVRLENLYTFHDPRREIDEVLHRLRSSLHFDARRDGGLARLLPPSLLRCHRVCVANKRASDALYFSRVPTPVAARFLVEHAWPAPLAGWLAAHAAELDHLLWDLGVDFHSNEGVLHITKSGIYGAF
jgi:hypothetical protein